MVAKVRRVVTGHDRDGKSTFLIDGIAPNVKEMESMPGLALTDLWETDGAPANKRGRTTQRRARSVSSRRRTGQSCGSLNFRPTPIGATAPTHARLSSSIGAGAAKDAHSADPMMHKTATVDYIIVIKGEIWAIMEKGETLLKAGDVLVQRGTNHSWSVRTKEPCIIAAVLVSANPVGKGGKAAIRKPAKGTARVSTRKVRKKATRHRR